jgi:hypothetical protein
VKFLVHIVKSAPRSSFARKDSPLDYPTVRYTIQQQQQQLAAAEWFHITRELDIINLLFHCFLVFLFDYYTLAITFYFTG